jgi:hypothetical protein
MKKAEENVEDLNLVQRMAEPTPDKSKKIGRVASAIATAMGAILMFGGITAPIGIAIVCGVGAVSTGVAAYHGQKVDPNGGKVNFLAKMFQSLKKD